MVNGKKFEQKYISIKLVKVIKMIQTELKQAQKSNKHVTFVKASDELAKRILARNKRK